ncbi:hypothetical protein C1J05_01095 [Sulfitobacter sp. JL08]|nr:hypothetical protein C1J05_01095 [Sulfitobacter sp. JL08]
MADGAPKTAELPVPALFGFRGATLWARLVTRPVSPGRASHSGVTESAARERPIVTVACFFGLVPSP